MCEKPIKEILEDLISFRDYSGSRMDIYAHNLMTLYFQSKLQGEQDAFLKLFAQAEAKNKFLVHVSPHGDDDPFDDYFVKDLIIKDEPEY